MSVNVHVVFYSMYGHIYQMAEAVAEGAREVAGAEVGAVPGGRAGPRRGAGTHRREAGPGRVRPRPGRHARATPEADAIIFGTPTRFGNVCAQMQNFLDQTGQLWVAGALIGKVGSVFTSTGTQHGGQETTIRSFHTELFHHGMVIVGVPYSAQG